MKDVSNGKEQYREYVMNRLKLGTPVRLENSERGNKLCDYTPVKFYREFVLFRVDGRNECFDYWETWAKLQHTSL